MRHAGRIAIATDTTSRAAHWDAAYSAKTDAGVSWYQAHPERSLALIEAASRNHRAAIIDVGGGASRLVDELLARGFSDLTVLDVSAVAIARARDRLGERAGQVAWVAADITQWQPARCWDIWHDRAVFHFLTEAAAQEAYLAALTRATRPGATVIIATFALDGPERCSGLPVQRYDTPGLAARLGDTFELYAAEREAHRTPGGAIQNFTYAAFRRR